MLYFSYCYIFRLGSKTSRDFTISSLYIVLKDHNNAGLQAVQAMSHSRVIQKAAQNEGFHLENIDLKEGEDYSLKPCSLWLLSSIDKRVADELLVGIGKMKNLIDVKVVNKLEGIFINTYFYLFIFSQVKF